MGSWWSDASPSETEEVTQVTTHNPFRFPPKGGGSYFGSHFIMGGERFETFGDSYLFGDNSDLNFLGSKPVPFPYPAPTGNEPTKALKALIYIRKETIKFVRVPDSKSYTIEFVFDSDCRCQITIMYFCREELTPSGVIYRPQDAKLCSEPIRFKVGAAQRFINPTHTFTPSLYPEAELQYDLDAEVYPVVIHCVALSGDEQSHSTTAFVDKHGEDTYVLKPLKQKLFVDGLAFLLQEIYGIENKHVQREGDDESQNAECVVCLSEMRDTIILPCRHLCLCHSCADSLRYQAQLCPICRSPFRALLQIRAVYKVPPAPLEYPSIPLSLDVPVVQMNAIPGFETVPLIEALNGPFRRSSADASQQGLPCVAVHAARELKSSDKSDSDQENPFSVPIALKVMVASSAVPRQVEQHGQVEVIVSPTPLTPAAESDLELDVDEVDEDPEEPEPQVIVVTTASHQSESCQATPISRHNSVNRQEEQQGSSLPTSPNMHTIPVSMTNVSTRSSGDSFTSAGSTKQLLSVLQQEAV